MEVRPKIYRNDRQVPQMWFVLKGVKQFRQHRDILRHFRLADVQFLKTFWNDFDDLLNRTISHFFFSYRDLNRIFKLQEQWENSSDLAIVETAVADDHLIDIHSPRGPNTNRLQLRTVGVVIDNKWAKCIQQNLVHSVIVHVNRTTMYNMSEWRDRQNFWVHAGLQKFLMLGFLLCHERVRMRFYILVKLVIFGVFLKHMVILLV